MLINLLVNNVRKKYFINDLLFLFIIGCILLILIRGLFYIKSLYKVSLFFPLLPYGCNAIYVF